MSVKANSRVIITVLISTILHLFVLWVANHDVMQTSTPRIKLAPFEPLPKLTLQRFIPKEHVTIGPQHKMERIPSHDVSSEIVDEFISTKVDTLKTDVPSLAQSLKFGIKEEIFLPQHTVLPTDTLYYLLPKQVTMIHRELPDLLTEGISPESFGKERSLVIIDPNHPRNLRIYLHIPANRPRGNEIEKFAFFVRKGKNLGQSPGVQLKTYVHNFEPEYQLNLNDLRDFPFIWSILLNPIPSLSDIVAYLREGGFLLAGNWLFDQVEAEMIRKWPSRVDRTYLLKDHPLFRSFYTINEYHYIPNVETESPCKISIMPVDALRLDGRIVALSTSMTYDPGFSIHPDSRYLRYLHYEPCLANRLFVNVFLYGMIQPGNIGARFIARTFRLAE